VRLTRSAIAILRHRRADTEETRRFLYLVVATIPAAIGGVLLEDYAETTFRSPRLMATTLMVMGVVLWAADRFAPRDRPLGGMRMRDAVLIGLAQVLALVPGVSRSGSTMTAGRALRFDRQSAAVFSFLMSMPVTAAAAVLKVPDLLRTEGITTPLVAGILSAAASSWLAIAVLLRYVSKHSFGVFALYRLALGALILTLLATRG
jgi:undecaprenyl-diphosphatase